MSIYRENSVTFVIMISVMCGSWPSCSRFRTTSMKGGTLRDDRVFASGLRLPIRLGHLDHSAILTLTGRASGHQCTGLTARQPAADHLHQTATELLQLVQPKISRKQDTAERLIEGVEHCCSCENPVFDNGSGCIGMTASRNPLPAPLRAPDGPALLPYQQARPALRPRLLERRI